MRGLGCAGDGEGSGTLSGDVFPTCETRIPSPEGPLPLRVGKTGEEALCFPQPPPSKRTELDLNHNPDLSSSSKPFPSLLDGAETQPPSCSCWPWGRCAAPAPAGAAVLLPPVAPALGKNNGILSNSGSSAFPGGRGWQGTRRRAGRDSSPNPSSGKGKAESGTARAWRAPTSPRRPHSLHKVMRRGKRKLPAGRGKEGSIAPGTGRASSSLG